MTDKKNKVIKYRKTFRRGQHFSYWSSNIEVCDTGPSLWWEIEESAKTFDLVVSNEEREGHRLVRRSASDWSLRRAASSYPQQTVFYIGFDRWLEEIYQKHPEVTQWYLALEA